VQRASSHGDPDKVGIQFDSRDSNTILEDRAAICDLLPIAAFLLQSLLHVDRRGQTVGRWNEGSYSNPCENPTL